MKKQTMSDLELEACGNLQSDWEQSVWDEINSTDRDLPTCDFVAYLKVRAEANGIKLRKSAMKCRD